MWWVNSAPEILVCLPFCVSLPKMWSPVFCCCVDNYCDIFQGLISDCGLSCSARSLGFSSVTLRSVVFRFFSSSNLERDSSWNSLLLEICCPVALSLTWGAFGDVQCELDIMFHLEKAHFMLEEMVMNGSIVEVNRQNILTPIQLMDKCSWCSCLLYS